MTLFSDADLPPVAPRIATLVERFGVPPFSVLDQRAGYWQDRKTAWLSLGIESELGRGGGVYSGAGVAPVVMVNGERVIPKEGDAIDTRSRRSAAETGRQKSFVGDGLLATSDSGNDPRYYIKKRAKEAELGHELSTAEWQETYYEGPDVATGRTGTGTSVFDPVLCELVYRWFVRKGGVVVDPFAGGSVRGIVAGATGHPYFGVDLSERQVEANREQYAKMIRYVPEAPTWHAGDSRLVLATLPRIGADLLFTCPPYYDLEVYSDDPADVSNMPTYQHFLDAYFDILRLAVKHHLKTDSYAAIVVGNLRDDSGALRDLVGDTIAAMRQAGCVYLNDAVLVSPSASAAIRAGSFGAGRRLIRTHQYLLVFVRGNPDKAAENAGPISASDAGVSEFA